MNIRTLIFAVVVDVMVASSAFGASVPAAPDEPSDEWVLTSRQQAFVERVDALSEKRARDGTLRERIAFSQYLDADDRGLPILRERVRIETLVDDARGATDPVVLQLLLHQCSIERLKGRCDTVAIARRWTEADTQNQVAWLGLAVALSARGDADGERAAFIRAASASTWQSGYTPVLRALVADLPRDVPPAERLALFGARSATASLVAFDASQTLNRLCKAPDPDMRTACTRIIETMARDGDTFADVTLASMIGRRGQFDAHRLRDFQRKSDALHWAFSQAASPELSLLETEDTPLVRGELARIDAMLLDGERRYYENRLARLGVTEADAAARYAASLSPEASKIHAERVTPP